MTDIIPKIEDIEVNIVPLDLTVGNEQTSLGIGETPSTNSANTVSTSPNNTTPADSNILPSGGGSIVKGFLKTQNFNKGVSGWSIDGNGDVEFNNGNFRGDITGSSGTFTGTITAILGSIAGWIISTVALYFDGATDADSSGMAHNDYPFYAGKKYADRATAPFKVEPSGKLTCTDIVATGTINAQAGYLSAGVYVDTTNGLLCESGGLNVGNAGHLRGGQTDYNTGTGFFLGYSSSAYKLSIGNSSDTSKLLLWDGTDLIVNDSVISNNDIFGDGSDGDVTISVDTTLTSDVFYNTLTVNNGITLNTGGYRVFVKNTLTNDGTISRIGNNGGDASAPTGSPDFLGGAGGSAGAALASGTIYGSPAGQVGADGVSAYLGQGDKAGNPGANGSAQTNVIGNSGVGGGAGGDPSGGTASSGGTATASASKARFSAEAVTLRGGGSFDLIKANAGSGSGASGGETSGNPSSQNRSGGGGGSGSGGGAIVICARIIVNNGVISVAGGNGGNGSNAAGNIGGAGAGGGGGGGGGNGGIMILIYSKKSGSGTYVITGGTKGTGGNGYGATGTSGSNGTDGATGTKIELVV